MQVLRRHVVKRADDPALEQCEERLGSVDVRRTANVFAGSVIDPLVTARKFPTDRDIAAPTIGHQRGAQIDVGTHDRRQRFALASIVGLATDLLPSRSTDATTGVRCRILRPPP